MRASLYTTSQLSKDTKLFCHSVCLKRNTFFVNVGHLRKKTLQLVLACAAFNLQPLKSMCPGSNRRVIDMLHTSHPFSQGQSLVCYKEAAQLGGHIVFPCLAFTKDG